jgi:hypothetical protein
MAAVAQAVAAAGRTTQAALAQADQAVARAHAVRDRDIDSIIQLKAVGVTPEYANAIRAISPRLSRVDADDLTGMKAVGVTPEYARALVASGLGNVGPDELTEARAIGLDGNYIRALIAAGVVADLDDFVQLRAVGVTPAYVQSLRNAGYVVRNADQLVEMWAVGVRAHDLGTAPPAPPRPPKLPPKDWDPGPDDGG